MTIALDYCLWHLFCSHRYFGRDCLGRPIAHIFNAIAHQFLYTPRFCWRQWQMNIYGYRLSMYSQWKEENCRKRFIYVCCVYYIRLCIHFFTQTVSWHAIRHTTLRVAPTKTATIKHTIWVTPAYTYKYMPESGLRKKNRILFGSVRMTHLHTPLLWR